MDINNNWQCRKTIRVDQKASACNTRSIGSLVLVLFLFTVAACGDSGISSTSANNTGDSATDQRPVDGDQGPDNGQNAPVNDDGQNAPVNDDGQNAPVNDDGQNAPVNDDGQNAPVNDDGQNAPVNDDGQNTPVNDDDENAGNQTNGSFTVSGALSANGVFQVDSDVNDPVTAAIENNTLASAQLIPNPAIVKGFATSAPTGVESDRFAGEADEFDVFRLSALTGQSIMLEIADFDTSNPASVDLDLGLFDLEGNLLEVSLSISNSFEALVVPADGEYFLAVNAFEGASNYTLSISTEFGTTAFDTQITVADVRIDQLSLADAPVSAENIGFVSNTRRGVEGQKIRTPESSNVVLGLNSEIMTSVMVSERNKQQPGNASKHKTIMSMQASGAVTQRAKTTVDALTLLELIKSMNSREGDDIFSAMQYPHTLQAAGTDPVPDRFIQWNLYDIGWSEAQDQLQNISFQKNPVIAVIDSGFFVSHPDLASVLIDQRDFVARRFDGDGITTDASEDVDVNGDPSCHGFHGTHVATTAVAPQNSIGITGVAPGTRLMGIKVGYNAGANCGLLVGDIPNAILYAAGLPNSSGAVPATAADVINLSLGGRNENPALAEAIRSATNAGVIVVAAAGNDGLPVRSFPAASENVIAVGATDVLDNRAPYSSFYPEVDIAAPGGDVTADQNGDGRPDGVVAGIARLDGTQFVPAWAGYQGTSMASPTVAAGIALMKAIAPNLTHDDVQAMLSRGDLTVDIGVSGFDNQTGFGLMSMPRMIQSAVAFADGGDGNSDAVSITTSTPTSLDFGAARDQISLELVRLGDQGVSVESLAASDSLFLANGTSPVSFVEPQSANGFGSYSFVLNRGALEAGVLEGSITFNLSDATSYVVPVSAVNMEGQTQSIANTAAVFFIVERQNASGGFDRVDGPFFDLDGVQGEPLVSPELPGGSYRVLFGTDTDNDLFICDEGELCGTFPFNNFGFDSVFTLDSNIDDAMFLLQDVSTIALTGFDGASYPAIRPRSISKFSESGR